MKDRSWVRLILSGEKQAGERFVLTYYAPIERMLRYLTGSADTARDLTQQTFIKAWQALPGFKFEASLATWLHRIAYHEYTHWLRDKREHAPLEMAHHLPAPIGYSDLSMMLLPGALSQLTDELRETFLLHYAHELSVEEIASIQQIPGGTVKSRLHTARKRLREALEATMNQESESDQNQSIHRVAIPVAVETLTLKQGN